MTPHRTDEARWQAVATRDATLAGQFVVAVKTTHIFCRPGCPARTPLRRNVEFFDSPAQAQAAGYRACLRCRPLEASPQRPEPLSDTIAAVCRALEAADGPPPTLAELGVQFAISPFHLQRTFKRLVGVSPRAYADAVRQGRLRAYLKTEPTVTEAVYAAGYGGSSAAYANADQVIGMSPLHFRTGGANMAIRYAITPCHLGLLLAAATERGLCKISLGDDPAALLADLAAEYPRANLTPDDAAMAGLVADLIAGLDGAPTAHLPLDIQATGFQRKVWEALRQIPPGSTRTYTQIAEQIGQPTAARAVAGACAANPVAVAIPCHRVVRAGGALSGYRWGVARKAALLEAEAAHSVAAPAS